MALSDVRGNPVSSDEPASMAAYERAQSLFHGYYGDPLGVIDEAERRGARVAFSNVSLHTLKLFELLGLTRLVVLAESEEDALATLEEFSTTPPDTDGTR